ncbi:MAG: phosphoribosylformylglycinamidine synthase subunit PurS [Verrucomicrobiota bacterium]
MRATVIVTPKTSVLDPQGEAVKNAIHHLGMDSVTSTRIGKFIELEIDSSDEASVKEALEKISHELLSNPVIEDYQVEVITD